MNYRIDNKPGFVVAGRTKQFTTTNGLNFKQIPLWWSEFMNSPDFKDLSTFSGNQPGAVTGGVILGVDFGSPDVKEFSYAIGIELPLRAFVRNIRKGGYTPRNLGCF